MSPTNAGSATMVTFTFPKDGEDGPILDPSGKIAYQLSTESSMFRTTPTVVYRPDGQRVGELSWKGWTHGQKVTLHGSEIKSLVTPKKEKWYKGADWVFQDAAGGEYAWNKMLCRTKDGRLLAKYTERKPHLIRKDEEATLSVEQEFLHMLDEVLFTCLEMAWKRKNKKEKVELTEAVLDLAGNIVSS
ncbi:hypothetical protein FRB94_002127 [Tulasnella sp. JGI-2019a]|nr:hypothetical protein FRB93_009108 [Tulasnella sp. JGI-2019a]KAG9013533.1 hypothetical protein FRB94_002127 [Tulasnella sp. JGI-2019a]KAG9037202.1 hypothetical protein FRB95_006455 [Tulasnella sp. JGI-2019a]